MSKQFSTTAIQDRDIAEIVQFRLDMNGRLDNIDWSECLWEIFDTVLSIDDRQALCNELANDKVSVYTHRNGETEPPTLEGKYWFLGNYEYHSGTNAPVQDTVTINEYGWGESEVHWARHVEHWRGRWWGPILAPWEER